jgi:uncharacterized protein
MNINQKNVMKSPCVRNCCLNEKDVCLGCYRHINEIIGWQGFTKEEKVSILDMCTKRKEDHNDNLK